MNLSSKENMGLNLPMLIANSQTLDNWNAVGQYSPPIGSERAQIHVPLPMPYPPASQNEMNVVPNPATRSLFGSSNSDLTASPQKPMDTSEMEIHEKEEAKHERPHSNTNIDDIAHNTTDTGGGAVAIGRPSSSVSSSMRLGAAGSGPDACSSPLPNTNTHEAHKNSRRQQELREQEELDIKQELVDYFHAPHPPAPPDSHRSYSSNEDNRFGIGNDSDEFAQDLRVSAAAAAAAKNLDFRQFVLQPHLRRRDSSESIEEKYTPLNMRKLNPANAAAAHSAASSAAGQMLIKSLLNPDGMSEENSSNDRLKSAAQDAASTSAAAAAAAFYAESLNRDDCDFIGSNVTLKLRSMDRTQRIIAEKLITEVLFYGQFNELERSARIQPK